MAHSFLIYDFGTNEEAAQQARHKLEAWKQGFRLGKKILLKFDREESEETSGEEGKPPARKKKSAAKDENAHPDSRVRLLIRLDFSDHEKLTQQRWLDRIPAEEPFKSAKGEIIRHADATFAQTADHFESLD